MTPRYAVEGATGKEVAILDLYPSTGVPLGSHFLACPFAYTNIRSCRRRLEARPRDNRDGSTRPGYVQCIDREFNTCRIHRLALCSYAYAGLDSLGRRLQVLGWAL